MAEFTSKVCIVGDFAVGKTSVSERFVSNHYSDKYLTTVGVKIDTKLVDVADFDVSQKLVIWDVAGADKFGATEFAYLRGAAGYLYVADGTRPPTIDATLALRKQVDGLHGSKPCVLLINKHDLSEQWDVRPAQVGALRERFDDVFLTSAKTGADVESAFASLAKLMTARQLEDLA